MAADVKFRISALDEASKVFKHVEKNLATLTSKTSTFSSAIGNIGSLVAPVAAVGTGIVAALGLGLKSMVDTASSFEDLEATLTTIEGSSDKAKKSLAWVKQFTAKTPYELAEVSSAFVKLKAFGLEPMQNGLLTSLGDAASAMGKPLEMIVEAVADAQTGENERLKEFGIKAKKKGDKITYSYQQNGETIRKTVDANNAALIVSTLQGIWNSKYAGAMDRRSKTFSGMLSNLADAWSDFQGRVANAGIFERIKQGLQSVLDKIALWAEDGTLDQWATFISTNLVGAFNELWAAVQKVDVKAVIQGIRDFITTGAEWYTTLGGLEGIATKVADVMGTYLAVNVIQAGAAVLGAIGPLINITKAMWALNAAFWASPLGLVSLAITALVAGVAALAYGLYQVIKYWDILSSSSFEDLGNWVKSWFDGGQELKVSSGTDLTRATNAASFGGFQMPAAKMAPAMAGPGYEAARDAKAAELSGAITIAAKGMPDWIQIQAQPGNRLTNFKMDRGEVMTP